MSIRRTMQRVALWTALLVCFFSGQAEVVPLAAQQGPGGRAQLEQRVRDRFAEIIQVRVGLDAEESTRLMQVLEEYRQERIVLAAETRSLRVKVRGAVAASGDAPVDDAEAEEYLIELRALAQREADLVASEQDELAAFLSPGQIVLIYQLRNQMAQRVQQLRSRRRNGRPPG